MATGDDDKEPPPFNRELVALLQKGLRAKRRFVAIMLGLATVTFVWIARDQGAPLWLVALIGFFGAVLICLFIALIWFWMFFLDHFRKAGAQNTTPLRGGVGVATPAPPNPSTPIPNPSPQAGREPAP